MKLRIHYFGEGTYRGSDECNGRKERERRQEQKHTDPTGWQETVNPGEEIFSEKFQRQLWLRDFKNKDG